MIIPGILCLVFGLLIVVSLFIYFYFQAKKRTTKENLWEFFLLIVVCTIEILSESFLLPFVLILFLIGIASICFGIFLLLGV